jgi:hypothetical protein
MQMWAPTILSSAYLRDIIRNKEVFYYHRKCLKKGN